MATASRKSLSTQEATSNSSLSGTTERLSPASGRCVSKPRDWAVLADLRQDGQVELIGYSNDTVTRGDSEYRQLVVFDKEGNLLRKWEVPSCASDVDVLRMHPAVGNLDDDPDLEIVAVSGCGTVAAFKLNQPDGPIWQAATAGTFVASPVVADLNQDGTNEVVIAASDPNNSNRGGVHAFDHQGKKLQGWPVLVEESFAPRRLWETSTATGSLKSAFRAPNLACCTCSALMASRWRAGLSGRSITHRSTRAPCWETWTGTAGLMWCCPRPATCPPW